MASSAFKLERLLHILSLETKDVVTMVQAELSQLGYRLITDNDNYVIGVPETVYEENDAEGKPQMKATEDFPKIAFVAHMDTVTRTGVNLEVHNSRITNKAGVLGADDRAGVFAILEIIEKALHKPLVIFTNYEETGGRGVKKMIRDGALKPYAKLVNLYVEPDRKGHNEYVYYSHALPKPIHAFAQKFGFKEDVGSYSDVCDITNEYHVPHVNLSIGYYGQHTRNEMLCILDLQNTMRQMGRMLVAKIPDVVMTKEEVDGPPKSYAWDSNNKNWTNGGGSTTSTYQRSSQAKSRKTYAGSYSTYEEYHKAKYGDGGSDNVTAGKSLEEATSPGTQAGETGSGNDQSRGQVALPARASSLSEAPDLENDPEYWPKDRWDGFHEEMGTSSVPGSQVAASTTPSGTEVEEPVGQNELDIPSIFDDRTKDLVSPRAFARDMHEQLRNGALAGSGGAEPDAKGSVIDKTV